MLQRDIREEYYCKDYNILVILKSGIDYDKNYRKTIEDIEKVTINIVKM